MAFSTLELEDLKAAKHILEHPGLAARISDVVGVPVEKGFAMLPEKWHLTVNEAARKTIETALKIALSTIKPDTPALSPANRWHKFAVGATGAAGGAFGLAALAIELPVSTAIMLRSIAAIARGQGENLDSAEARLQCIQVLALGGLSKDDDAAETGYFAVRAAMAKAVSDAAAHLTRKGLADKSAPVIVRFIARVAARFSIVVSEKAVAQAVPVVGALGGALINTLFIGHFQDIGRAHFTIRRLERCHGPETVRRIYGEV